MSDVSQSGSFLNHPLVKQWLRETRSKRKELETIYGRYMASIVWKDEVVNGEIIGGSNPDWILKQINEEGGWPIFHTHDPGIVLGRLADAKMFTDSDGIRFVVGLGLMYTDKTIVPFEAEGGERCSSDGGPIDIPDSTPTLQTKGVATASSG